MVDENAPNAERVAEVEAGHSSELIDEFSLDPDAFGVVMVDGVQKAVFGGEEAWRGAGPKGEDGEGDEVEESHSASKDGEGGMIRRSVVVPPQTGNGSRNVDERVSTV